MSCEHRWEYSLHLLQGLFWLHLEPDEVTYNGLLLAVRPWRQQFLLLKGFGRYRLAYSVPTYAALGVNWLRSRRFIGNPGENHLKSIENDENHWKNDPNHCF